MLNGIQIDSDVEALIIIRKRCGLSQFQFSEEIGVSKNYLSDIENYRVPISSKFRGKIEDFLKYKYSLYVKELK